jgi:hypothetical protein
MMLAGKRGGVLHGSLHTQRRGASISMHRSGILPNDSTVLVCFVVGMQVDIEPKASGISEMRPEMESQPKSSSVFFGGQLKEYPMASESRSLCALVNRETETTCLNSVKGTVRDRTQRDAPGIGAYDGADGSGGFDGC